MKSVRNSSTEGEINLSPDVKVPEERVSFWKGAMAVISQKVINGVITEEQANDERARIIAYKESLASIDTLTNLTNRRDFEEAFEKGHAIAKRTSSSLSLLFIDADDLKAINNFGHDKGDEFLVKVASAIKGSIREDDTGSRWGGDEFAVLCLGSNLEGALLIAERILNKVRACEIEGRKLTVSIGAGEIDISKDVSINDHLKKIDQALLQAKKSGKNQIVTVNLNG